MENHVAPTAEQSREGLSSTAAERPWISRIFDSLEAIRRDASQIYIVASAMDRVGMSRAADELTDIGLRLEKAAEAIQRAASGEVDASFKRSQEATSNILLTAMSVAKRANAEGRS